MTMIFRKGWKPKSNKPPSKVLKNSWIKWNIANNGHEDNTHSTHEATHHSGSNISDKILEAMQSQLHTLKRGFLRSGHCSVISPKWNLVPYLPKFKRQLCSISTTTGHPTNIYTAFNLSLATWPVTILLIQDCLLALYVGSPSNNFRSSLQTPLSQGVI